MPAIFRAVLSMLLLAGLLGTGPSATATDLRDRLSTPQLIERAVEMGEIDRNTGWLYLAYSVGPNWDVVPERYIGGVPWSGTIPILRVQRAIERMEAGADREALETALYGDAAVHPGPGGIGTDRCLAFAAPALTRLTAHYYIEYNPGTIGGGVDIDDYVNSLETTWVREVDEFGWPAPPVYPPNPAPENKYHVRIEPLGPLLYGFVTNVGTHAGDAGDNPHSSWWEPDAQASCMTHNSNYEAFPGTTQDALDATSAHEFDHSLNYGIGAFTGPNDPDLNFSEGGATWKEDEVFDESNDNYNYLWPDFDDDMGEHEGNEYSYWIVFRGMVERYGTTVPGGSEDVMQDYWELTSRSINTPIQLDAMNQALVNAGTNLPDAYHAMAVAVRFLRPCDGLYFYPYCLAEGPAYEDFAGEPDDHGSIDAIGESFDGSIPDNYALDWISLPTTGGPYDVRLQNTSTGGALRGTVACDTGSGLQLFAMPAVVGAGGSTSVDGVDPTGCGSIYAVLTNQLQTAPDPEESEDRDYTLSLAAASSARTLTVSKVGTGGGTVSSDPAKISCGATCSGSFNAGQTVTLRAEPAKGSRFTGWSGGCSGTDSCRVQMTAARSVSARFDQMPRIVGLPRFQTDRTFTVSWEGAVEGTTQRRFDLRYRAASPKGRFGKQQTWQQSTAATSAEFSARRGVTYCFSARIPEVAGGVFGDEACTTVPLDDRQLRHEGGWKRRSPDSAYLDSLSLTRRRGASLVEPRIRGRRVAIVASPCPKCGRVEVSIGRRSLGSVRLRGPAGSGPRIYELRPLRRARRGTLTVEAISGRKVRIDGVGVSRV